MFYKGLNSELRLTNKQSNYNLEIVIREGDLKDFKGVVYDNQNIKRTEPLEGIGLINVEFISGEENYQRNQ